MTEPVPITQNTTSGNSLQLKIVQQGQECLSTPVLARILTTLSSALESFLLAELMQRYSNPKPALKKEISRFASVTQLAITDVDLVHFVFTFEIARAGEEPAFRLLKSVSDLQQQLFALFLQTVFTAEIFNETHIEKLSKRYQAKERVRIFKPVYDHLINPVQGYQVFFAVKRSTAFKTWPLPEGREVWSGLIPEAGKKAAGQSETYYQYVKTGEINDLFGKRSKYEKVLIKESPQHDVYPYQLQKIRVKGKTYRFSNTLTASVKVENGLYRIALPELQLRASHLDRAGAEAEFDAALANLIGRLEKADGSMDAKTRAALLKLKELLVDI